VIEAHESLTHEEEAYRLDAEQLIAVCRPYTHVRPIANGNLLASAAAPYDQDTSSRRWLPPARTSLR
jgi:hypothetical protein